MDWLGVGEERAPSDVNASVLREARTVSLKKYSTGEDLDCFHTVKILK